MLKKSYLDKDTVGRLVTAGDRDCPTGVMGRT